MDLNSDKDCKHLLEVIATCSEVGISSYILAKVLTKKQNPLGQNVPRMIQMLEEMLEDGLIQLEASPTNEAFGYVISEKGKEFASRQELANPQRQGSALSPKNRGGASI